MTSWSAPVNMMANVLDSLQQNPQVAQMMLGLGPAYDVMKSVPIDLLANIPHYESEVEGSNGKSTGRNESTGQQSATAGNPGAI